jgi:hypothetical protein
MNIRGSAPVFALAIIIAFCGSSRTETLKHISNRTLRDYTAVELERGAPSLMITSRVLYREALDLADRGKRDEAIAKLNLAASIAGDYPDPMFTLAKLELLSGNPECITHFGDGLMRIAGGFRSHSLLALNASLLIIIAASGSLFILLIALLFKYWPLLNHKLMEQYSKKFSFPPKGWIGFLIIIGLLIMRLGLAIYAAILLMILWSSFKRREKGAVVTLVAVVSLCSFISGYTNTFVEVFNPGSVTWRLSLINERGSDHRLLDTISSIKDPEFEAEKDFALGTIMYRMGYLEDAQAHLLSSVSKKRDFPNAYLNLGNVYFNQGDFDKALAGYQNAIAIDSTNALAHYNIGQTYIKTMLFAESSSSLKKANNFGIEEYRTAHPTAIMRNLTIYESGFETGDLWSIALREGGGYGTSILDEILRPWLLFPLHWLGFLLLGSLIAAAIIGRSTPKSWKAFRCENCSDSTCPDCADSETGLLLCPACSGVIKGLTSIKVMEALLRHRRQKMSAKLGGSSKLKTMFFPGAAHFYHGVILSGIITSSINICALMLLIWGGFYMKDPRILTTADPLWQIILPAVVILSGYLVSMRIKTPPETRNYRILPPDMQVGEEEKGPKKEENIPQEEVYEEPVGSFLDSL